MLSNNWLGPAVRAGLAERLLGVTGVSVLGAANSIAMALLKNYGLNYDAGESLNILQPPGL